MDLHTPEGFAAYVSSLPGTSQTRQWEARVAKVGGKVFALLGDDAGHRPGAVVFKVSNIAFDGLIELEGIDQAAYFARRMWVRVAPGALEPELLAGYVAESHRLVAAKLTRKLRAKLGL